MEKQYRYFYEVARQGSIKAAADKLFISQPTLTTAIKKLEDVLGTLLFHRKSKGVELTSAGWVYYRYVQDIYEKHGQMMHQLSDMKARSQGKIKIGIGEAWWECFAADVIKQFIETHPNNSLYIEFGNGLSMLSHLLNGDIDLFIGHEIENIDSRNRVRFIPLFTERESLYVREGHPLLNDEALSLHDYPQIKVTPDHTRDGKVLNDKGAETFAIKAQQVKVVYELDSLKASIDMLKMSDSIMPYTDKIKEKMKDQNIATLPITDHRQGVVGIYSNTEVLSENMEYLVNLFKQ
ncbi:LysR family transcriptional regulator [Aliivibrio sp. 1S165]|uniref:LysR family transcriptional regulator n=1 Tax=unclassified Aliivibrio TaxID=2645654 RepID=UPI00080E7B54|nr:LysR family transcriptional regulator [Aliivibrio sp. 1S165]OCH31606.1 LysR family transcriptional regulator [Aliivibrio sp. 1S175]